MRARPEVVAISDYSKGLGHADVLTIGAEQLVEMKAARPDNWGPNPTRAAPRTDEGPSPGRFDPAQCLVSAVAKAVGAPELRASEPLLSLSALTGPA